MKYFSKSEVECGCGCGMTINPKLGEKLDELREKLGRPVNLNSAARCDEYNKYIGSPPTSSHTIGLAADIRCSGSTERFEVTKAAIGIGIVRIGIHNSFIHIDIDEDKPQEVIWNY